MDIRAATAADLDAISTLLRSAKLPFEDLQPGGLGDFLVARSAPDGTAEPAGLIGLERFADIGLLRSLVVVPSARGAGLGAQLMADLERLAAAAAVRELWLLTIDADAYFERFGYTTRDRADAPPAIRETAEFSTLCPGSAILMSKTLQAG